MANTAGSSYGDKANGSQGGDREEASVQHSMDFLEFVSGHVLGSIATASDLKAVQCAKEKLKDNNNAFQGLGHVSNLVDEIPMVLYRLLVGSRLQQMDEKELVKRGFEAFLADCANNYKSLLPRLSCPKVPKRTRPKCSR